MQVEGFVRVIVQMIGDLTNIMGGAAALFGEHTMTLSQYPSVVNDLTVGIFGTKDGLIYWMKNDFIYLVNNLGTTEMAARLANFIAALIVGSGATDGFTFYTGV
jgi:hypothetical protein